MIFYRLQTKSLLAKLNDAPLNADYKSQIFSGDNLTSFC